MGLIVTYTNQSVIEFLTQHAGELTEIGNGAPVGIIYGGEFITDSRKIDFPHSVKLKAKTIQWTDVRTRDLVNAPPSSPFEITCDDDLREALSGLEQGVDYIVESNAIAFRQPPPPIPERHLRVSEDEIYPRVNALLAQNGFLPLREQAGLVFLIYRTPEEAEKLEEFAHANISPLLDEASKNWTCDYEHYYSQGVPECTHRFMMMEHNDDTGGMVYWAFGEGFREDLDASGLDYKIMFEPTTIERDDNNEKFRPGRGLRCWTTFNLATEQEEETFLMLKLKWGNRSGAIAGCR